MRYDLFCACSAMKQNILPFPSLLLVPFLLCAFVLSFQISITTTTRAAQNRRTYTKHYMTEEQSASSSDRKHTRTSKTIIMKNNKTSRGQGEDATPKGPIYITIGPQCSGKTSFLKRLLTNHKNHADPINKIQSPISDITIDDQKGVYLKIPAKLFLSRNLNSPSSTTTCTDINHDKELLSAIVHNKTIAERIRDAANDEMRLVVQRLCDELSTEEFRRKVMEELDETDVTANIWKRLPHQDKKDAAFVSCKENDPDSDAEGSGRDSEWKICLIQAVEEHYRLMREMGEGEGELVIDHCDLFVVEGIFQSPKGGLTTIIDNTYDITRVIDGSEDSDSLVEWPQYIANCPLSGLNAAISKLKYLACDYDKDPSMPVAWGNTNTKPRDYIPALEAAERSRRSVHFVPYTDLNQNRLTLDDAQGTCSTLMSENEEDFFFLPRVGVKELIYRNIKRFVDTGRYIPTRATIDASIKVHQLMQRSMTELQKGNNGTSLEEDNNNSIFTKFELDRALVNLAGYGMNSDRTVYKLSVKNRGQRSNGGRQGRGRGRGQRFERGGGRGRNRESGRGRGRSSTDGRGRGNVRGRVGKDEGRKNRDNNESRGRRGRMSDSIGRRGKNIGIRDSR